MKRLWIEKDRLIDGSPFLATDIPVTEENPDPESNTCVRIDSDRPNSFGALCSICKKDIQHGWGSLELDDIHFCDDCVEIMN